MNKISDPHNVLTPEKSRQLLEWSANWLNQNITTDQAPYVKAITTLWAATGDGIKALATFRSLVLEATTLEKSGEWLLSEMRFEAQANAVGNRQRCALFALESHNAPNNEALDIYNQRMNRVIPP